MKEIYGKILEKALPFYEQGREGDVEHIRWLSEVITEYVDESEVDFDILIPVVLLHDVGYARVPQGSNPFNLDIRKFHSEQGAEIAEEILGELEYPKDKIAEVKRLILKHDNWAFGDDFSDEPILRIFSNFDFMWMATEKGFDIVRKFMKQEPEEFYKQIGTFQKKNEEEGRTWVNEKIEAFYHQLMNERKQQLSRAKGANL
ncbi:HD domain-containing protein [Candidatus Woesearchaeota archaeon]|nr:HD domain-containing protein [Candidatus Woesearchaeota archaeon]